MRLYDYCTNMEQTPPLVCTIRVQFANVVLFKAPERSLLHPLVIEAKAKGIKNGITGTVNINQRFYTLNKLVPRYEACRLEIVERCSPMISKNKY